MSLKQRQRKYKFFTFDHRLKYAVELCNPLTIDGEKYEVVYGFCSFKMQGHEQRIFIRTNGASIEVSNKHVEDIGILMPKGKKLFL